MLPLILKSFNHHNDYLMKVSELISDECNDCKDL